MNLEAGSSLKVTVDAIDGPRYLNGKSMRLELSQNADVSVTGDVHDIPQTGPGRYELQLPAPREPSFVTVRVEGQVVEQSAIAGRYAPEFDAIGNDHDAMRTLARRTGGQVIPPRQTWAIDFRWPRRTRELRSIFAMFGTLLIGLGLGWSKWR